MGPPRGLWSASRMVDEPGLQVAEVCEIEQIFRQLLQLLQRELTKPLTAGTVNAAEASCKEPDGQGNGFLLTTGFQTFLTAFQPSLLQDLLHRAGVAQLLQRQTNDHEDLLPAEL